MLHYSPNLSPSTSRRERESVSPKLFISSLPNPDTPLREDTQPAKRKPGWPKKAVPASAPLTAQEKPKAKRSKVSKSHKDADAEPGFPDMTDEELSARLRASILSDTQLYHRILRYEVRIYSSLNIYGCLMQQTAHSF